MQNMQGSGTSPAGSATELGDRAASGVNRVADTAHQTVDRMAGMASSAAERLGARGEEWVHAKDEAFDSARAYVREHPIASIGMALAVGMLLSKLTSR